MSPPYLSPEDEDRVIAALVAVGWMEFPFDTTRETIGSLLACSTDESTRIWKDLRDRNVIALRNKVDSRHTGLRPRSWWKWVKDRGSQSPRPAILLC
jgi:hypothetical protein